MFNAKRFTGAMMAAAIVTFGCLNSTMVYAQESYYDVASEYHSGVDYKDMKYVGINEKEAEAVIEQFLKDIEKDDNGDAVTKDFDAIVDMYDFISTQYALNEINYYNDVDDEDASKNDTYLSEYSTVWTDKMFSALRKGLESEYASVLKEKIGDED